MATQKKLDKAARKRRRDQRCQTVKRKGRVNQQRKDRTMPATVYLVTPLTDTARSWVNDNVHEPFWMGSGFAVEWRYLENLLSGMELNGLFLDVDFSVIS